MKLLEAKSCSDLSGVSGRYEDEQRLKNWWWRQRDRRMLTDDEKEKLQNIQHAMSVAEKTKLVRHDKAWENYLSALLEYRKEYHTFMISKKDVSQRQLYDWVARQRKMKRKNMLSQKREQMLLDIGFDFEPIRLSEDKPRYTKAQTKRWDNMYAKLLEYKTLYGHCNVKHGDKDNQELAKWIYQQRVIFRNNTIDSNRRKRLDAIGFEWSGR